MCKENGPICIHLEMEPYLRQWLIAENGGVTPISFPKLSIENRILEIYLRKLPWNAIPDKATDHTVAIAIPEFRHTDPRTYNYLPKAAMQELKNCIRQRFLIQLWTDLHQFGHIGSRRDHLIYAWMETHGIEINDTNFNTLAKIYQRQHRAYKQRQRRKNKKEKKSKKSS